MTLQHCEECHVTTGETRIASRYLDTSNGWQITDEESEETIPLCEEHIREITSTPIPYVPNTFDPEAQCSEHGCARWRCDESHGESAVEMVTDSEGFEQRADLPFELHRMGGPTWNRDWEHVDRFATAAGALARAETFERGTRVRIVDLRAKSQADGMIVWHAVTR